MKGEPEELNEESKEALQSRIKQLEAELAFYQLVFDNMQVGVGVGTEDYRFVTVNRHYANLFDLHPEDFKGKAIPDLYNENNPDENPVPILEHNRIANEQGFNRFDWWKKRKDGSVFPVSITLKVVRDEQGKFLYRISTATDITRRLEVENALAREKSILKAILESIGEGVVIADRDGKVTLINSKGREILNKDISGQSLVDWKKNYDVIKLNGGDYDEGKLPLTRVIQGDSSAEAEIYMKNLQTDEEKHIYVTATEILDIHGKRIGGVAIFRDITKLVETRNLLEVQKENLEKSNDDLRQFAYVASHDLQEPLRVILSFVQLLDRKYRSSLDETGQKYLSFIEESTQRMQVLIRDLLGYSRLEHREVEMEDGIRMDEIIDEAIENLALMVKETEAGIKVDADVSVKGNHSMLVQLVQNLLNNAMKYRSYRTPEIEIGVTDAGEKWQFFIKDNGIGIPEEFQEKVFEIFKRLHRKEEYPGTGIGLAMCRKIIERLGGEIWLKSEPGSGSTFFFTLPKGN